MITVSYFANEPLTNPVLYKIGNTYQVINLEQVPTGESYFPAPHLKQDLERIVYKKNDDDDKFKKVNQDNGIALKIIIMGTKKSGKTKLYSRIFGYPKEHDVDSMRREEVNYEIRSFVPPGEMEVKMHIWDVNDNNVAPHITDYGVKLRGVKGIILTYDTNNENCLIELKRILQMIKEDVQADVKIVIVGTKNDLPKKVKQEDINAIIQMYNLTDAGEISLLRDDNIEKPFFELAKLINKSRKISTNTNLKNRSGEDINKAIEALTTYINNRSSNKNEYYYGFFSKIWGGVSKSETLEAANMLKNVISGEQSVDFISPYKKALNDGDLKKIFDQYKHVFGDFTFHEPILATKINSNQNS